MPAISFQRPASPIIRPFSFTGMTNQVFYELYVAISGNKKFSEFTYNGITYRYIPSRLDIGVETKYDGMIR